MDLVKSPQYRRFILAAKVKESDFDTLETLKAKIGEVKIIKSTTFALLPENLESYARRDAHTRYEMELRSRGE